MQQAGEKWGKELIAALGYPRGEVQSLLCDAPLKGQEGTGTRCSNGKIIHPESEQALDQAPREAGESPA